MKSNFYGKLNLGEALDFKQLRNVQPNLVPDKKNFSKKLKFTFLMLLKKLKKWLKKFFFSKNLSKLPIFEVF